MTQARALAFFPWWAITADRSIGPIRLRAFRRGQAPGDLRHATQADLDAVLTPYATRPHRQLRAATLLEVDDWEQGQDPEQAIPRLFTAQEALAFAGLASRRLFAGHFGYCCYDYFDLVVQRYDGNKAHFAYYTRRRDGRTHHAWSTRDFEFQPPLQVTGPIQPDLDEALIELLMHPDCSPKWTEAIYEFNHANRDSTDLLEHVEMIMVKSAFERLLDIGGNGKAFETALLRVLPDPDDPFPPGPVTQAWQRRSVQPQRLLGAWAREFSALRGASAHGIERRSQRSVWSEAAHLAFASILFPLLVKQLAAQRWGYQMRGEDTERLRRLDAYLTHDPFAPRSAEEDDTAHPWAAIDASVREQAIARMISRGLEARFGLASEDGPPVDG